MERLDQTEPANLQTRRQLTVREAAKLYEVSERLIYLTRKLLRSGRDDLVQAVERGEITIHRALQILAGPRPKDGLTPLIRAWNSATEAERSAFIRLLTGEKGATPPGLG
jgi:hypothetical protein